MKFFISSKFFFIVAIIIFIVSLSVFVYFNRAKIPFFYNRETDLQKSVNWLEDSNPYVKETRQIKSYTGKVINVQTLINDPKNLAIVTIDNLISLVDKNNQVIDVTIPKSFLENSVQLVDKSGNETVISADEFNKKLVFNASIYVEISYSTDQSSPDYVNNFVFYEQ